MAGAQPPRAAVSFLSLSLIRGVLTGITGAVRTGMAIIIHIITDMDGIRSSMTAIGIGTTGIIHLTTIITIIIHIIVIHIITDRTTLSIPLMWVLRPAHRRLIAGRQGVRLRCHIALPLQRDALLLHLM